MKDETLYPCLNIYPKEKGGLKEEIMPLSSISPVADRWLDEDKGRYCYLQKFEGNSLIPYCPLPEKVEISASLIAKVLSCPYSKLKAIKTGILDKLKDWIPVVILIAAIIFLVMVGGD